RKYKDNPNTNALDSNKQKKKKEKEKSKKPQKAVDEMDKTDLVRAMQYEHPTRTLDIGTVNGNLNRILTDKPQLRSKIKACLQEVVRHASKTKRTCQRAIGQYIEQLQLPMSATQTENCSILSAH
ncbi:hypothetical protein BX616_008590, partial [Lobosporangium transversale]